MSRINGQQNSSFNFASLSTALVLCFMFLLSSCIETSPGRRRSSASAGTSTETPDPVGTPIFTNDTNYFQDGAVKSTSVFDQSVFSSDTYFLRGKNINLYIQTGYTTTAHCLVHHFPNTVNNQILVLAATPQSFNNYTTNTIEHYYLIKPNDQSTNQTFCQQPALINALNTLYPAQSIVYRFTDICPGCSLSTFTSNATKLYSTGGANVSAIDLSYLSLRLQNTTPTDTGAVSCTNASTCMAQGYDCCLNGQCVIDASIKSTTNTSSTEFLQSVEDIAANASAINNYPHLYNICPINVIPTPTPTPTPNPQDEASDRLLTKKELYDCLNPVKGEQGFCTSIYDTEVDTSGTYPTGTDDLSFNTIYSGMASMPMHGIDKITYGGVTLFTNGAFTRSGVTLNGQDNTVPSSNLNGNDDLTSATLIALTGSFIPPSNSEDGILRIRYKADSSCERLSSALARCKKYYVQGQNTADVDDHFPASNEFKLPVYADTSKQIKVEIDGSVRYQGTHWNIVAGAPSKIVFNGANLAVFDTQVVTMTYYVDLNTWPVLQGVETARDRVRDMCDCVGEGCNLTPVTNTQGTVVDYQCLWPDNTSPPPLQQTIVMSSKTVPVRYYDENGTPHTSINGATPPQEGEVFAYASNNLGKPNNVDNYIGFNEIYGSISTAARNAKPAKELQIVQGKTYDIFVDQGGFSTCYYCGNDSWSAALKLFPQNFTYKGGGYLPNPFETNQKTSTTYRADDLIFGRACFLPVTMIPWTHRGSSSRQDQRLRRMQAQHFLFANGYQRDWFGFDYGSIIGSFDGLTWFAVGNQRRVQAKSNKLFLAVNAYFGDQTDENTFTITVSDASAIPNSGSIITSDFNSDGAECQQYHVCNTDQDCATQLGWEYSCQSVNALKTMWPDINENGLEIPESESLKGLTSLLVGNFVGGTKRCVYRGRGAACAPNYNSVSVNSSYSSNAQAGLHACTPNNYCQPLVSGGVNVAKFNNSIARWARPVTYQNISSDVVEDDLDEFGKHARTIGRPQNHIGDEEVRDITKANLLYNNLTAICLPGRNPMNNFSSLLDFEAQNAQAPHTSTEGGDRVLGIGVTRIEDSIAGIASCPAFDESGNLIQMHQDYADTLPTDPDIENRIASQNMSSRLWERFGFTDILQDFIGDQVTKIAIEENRCLRAPGSACHTDYDCAVNPLIANKLSGVDPKNPPAPYSLLNQHEIKYWQEGLVCKQAVSYPNSDFNLKQNRCCREDTKTLSIATHYPNRTSVDVSEQSNYADVVAMNNVLGLGQDPASNQRYSRWNTIADLRQETNIYPGLSAPVQNQQTFPLIDLQKQYNTFSEIASRTCCGGHWVRKFHKNNGGGHQWTPARHQKNIKAKSFACYNWTSSSHSCVTSEDPADPDCSVRNIDETQANAILKEVANLELAGIPQARFVANSNITNMPELLCNDRTDTIAFAESNSGVSVMLTEPGSGTSDTEITDGTQQFYSLAAALFDGETIGSANFNTSQIKAVFSEDEVVCCKPAGSLVEANADPKVCCTGLIRPINGTYGACALPDYTNVSVHMNRYVSSIAKDLDATLIDEETGYIKDPAVVEQLACQLDVCYSGYVARGVSYSALPVTGHQESNPEFTTRRFLEGDAAVENGNGLLDLWNAGLRWNNQVYCVPSNIPSDSPDLIVTPCN